MADTRRVSPARTSMPVSTQDWSPAMSNSLVSGAGCASRQIAANNTTADLVKIVMDARFSIIPKVLGSNQLQWKLQSSGINLLRGAGLHPARRFAIGARLRGLQTRAQVTNLPHVPNGPTNQVRAHLHGFPGQKLGTRGDAC